MINNRQQMFDTLGVLTQQSPISRREQAMQKILVIEDDVFLRRSLLKILRAEGFYPVEAKNGKIGRELAQTEKPDLILCHLVKPDCQNHQLLKQLKAEASFVRIPVIGLTNPQELANLRQVKELCVDNYLIKPYTKSELINVIKAQLHQQEQVNLKSIPSLPLLNSTSERVSLSEQFEQMLRQFSSINQSIPILVLNLDRLERFQNYLGIDYGELLIQAVINRIHTSMGEQTIAVQWNGEKIVLMLAPLTKPEDIEAIADQLLNCLSQPIQILEYKLLLGGCLGIALYPEHDQNFDNLLIKANIALRQAQQQGTHSYFTYSNEFWLKTKDRFHLEIELHHALERDELVIHYQPQLDLKTGKIVGAEALVRWQHPQRGLIPPLDFLTVAEETDLIVYIDEWMIRQVCRQLKQWQNQGFKLSVAVNISGVRFHQRNLGSYVMQVLKETGLEPSCLELELTESVLVKNPERSVAILNELKNLGIGLSLDDFGTGYSSLSYLQKFPFDTLKLDRCFVQDVNNHQKNAAIVQATIVMAHSLEMRVIAEGVETDGEQQFLHQRQCDCLQGYWFSRPVVAQVFEEMLIASETAYKSLLRIKN